MNRGQVQQPCEEQVQPKEIKELIIVIRQQTMTKKMLVKTESVDMTGMGAWGRSSGLRWVRLVQQNKCECVSINFFLFFCETVFKLDKRNSHPMHRQSHS